MHVIRPVRETDIDVLCELVTGTGVGMTSLPRDRNSLARRVQTSLETVEAGPARLADAERALLFVLEDLDTGAVVGTTGLHTGIGLSEPFYSYRVSTVVHASPTLGVHQVIPTLYLNNDYTGGTEVGSLFLHSGHRGGGLGRLLSRSRLLLLANHRDHFPEKVIAEMRGVTDARGRSPFWDGLGRHFFSMPFRRADHLTGTRGKRFIAELMPRNPIYVPLLPPAAQEVIGEVHPDTRRARALLEAEGFHYEGYVDIFDGGATLEARIGGIDAVIRSRALRLTPGQPAAGSPQCLVATMRWSAFRCVLAPLEVRGTEAVVDEAVAEALAVPAGETVRAVPVDPDARHMHWLGRALDE